MKKIIFLFSVMLSVQGRAQDCDALSFYSENFESVTVPAIPGCVSISSGLNSNSWATANNPGNGFESNALIYSGIEGDADAWYFTKGIAMTAGTWYKISYRYGNDSSTTSENLKVTVGNAPDGSGTDFQTHEGITGGAPNVYSTNLYPTFVTGIYYFGFHATSSAGQGSLYIDDIIIEPTTCNTPANPKAANVLPTSATLSWDATAGNNNTAFSVYQYGYMTTNTPPAGPPELKLSTATSVDVSDLAPSTTYYLFVRSQCGPVYGDWSEGTAFTTPACEATSVPYTQDFESSVSPGLPECTSASTANTGNQWVTGNNPGNGFENNTLHYAAGNESANAWFFTQGVTLVAGAPYRISYKYGNNSAVTTESLKVIMATSPNPASEISQFNDHTGITGGAAVNYELPFSFQVAETGVYYFGFNAHSDAEQGNLYVDDIAVEDWICSEPANITASDITTTGATLSWEAQGNPAVGYLYSYNTTNQTPDNQNFVPALTTTLSGLEPDTTYYFFLKGICGPVIGDWSQSVSFTTPACEPTTVPYILDFESVASPAVPVCTIAESAISGNDWVTANNPGSGFTSKTLVYTATNDPANSWFYTQGVQLTEDTYYKVSYKYGNNSTTSSENLKVTLNSNPNVGYQINSNFGNHTGITGDIPAQSSIEYFNVPTGIYYFGFNAHSDSGQGNLYVDDFRIEVIDCGEPINGTASNVTETTAAITWEAASSGNATPNVYHFAYSTVDAPPAEWESIPDTHRNLDGLTAGTQYFAFVRIQCGPTWSEWITIPFVTDAVAGLNSNVLKNIAAYPNPVKDILNLDSSAIIGNIEVYNITGQLVYSQAINSQKGTVNLQNLAAGPYLVTITNEYDVKRIKIIKE